MLHHLDGKSLYATRHSERDTSWSEQGTDSDGAETGSIFVHRSRRNVMKMCWQHDDTTHTLRIRINQCVAQSLDEERVVRLASALYLMGEIQSSMPEYARTGVIYSP